MKTILITGGTGLTGKALTKVLLQKGYRVTVLTRAVTKESHHPNLSFAEWNIKNGTIDVNAVENADCIVHLAGAPVVEKRWTSKRKKEIADSRIKSSQLLVKAMRQTSKTPEAVICASAIGWYGPDKKKTANGTVGFIETDPSSPDFLGQTCQQWEAAIDPVVQMNVRLVRFRIGIVLSKDGGALKEFMRPMKFGINPIMGSGKQIISWIHIDDLVNVFVRAIEDKGLAGTFNAVAPLPTTNKQLMTTIAKLISRKWLIPLHTPPILLKSVLGERSSEVLKSATVSCEKIRQAGFKFQYTNIHDALAHLLANR